jgi:general secretion pathway protein M
VNPALPPWLSRATALALLFGLILLAYAVVIAPLVAGYRQSEGAVAEARELLAGYRTVAARRDQLEAQLAALADRQDDSGLYLAGATDALAAAALQDDVKGAIEAGGGNLRSIQILTAEDEEGFRRVGVRVQLTATVSDLLRILHGIEAGRPFLFVDALEVNNRRARRRSRDEAETMDPVLLVRLDVAGYQQPRLQ